MIYINTPNALKHHGVEGMHWGERKYQYKDGSLTPEGRVHYGYNTERAKANVEAAKKERKSAVKYYNKKTAYGMTYDAKAAKRVNEANRKLRYAKEDLSDEKTKEKLNKETKVSKRRESLEVKYREKGMTEEEAAIAAYKRERTEKILAVAGGVAVTALVAYGAYKYHDYAFDKVIPSGTKLQNISKFANKGVDDAFYASWKSSDNDMYRGLYGKQTKDAYGKAYEAKFKVTGNGLKIASPKNAKDTMAELMRNDPDFRNNAQKIISETANGFLMEKHAKVYGDADKALKSGKFNNAVYKALNTSLVDRSSEGMAVRDKLYSELKKKGYGGIDDLNDKKGLFGNQAGYGSKSPLIVFDGKSSLTSLGSRELSDRELSDAFNTEIGKTVISEAAKTGGLFVASTLAGNGVVKIAKNKYNDKIVSDYRKEHPNTELSYKDIVRQYEKQLVDKS